MKIYVINGPNLNMLGVREPETYGTVSYDAMLKIIRDYCKAAEIDVICYQSNHEGDLVSRHLISIKPKGGFSVRQKENNQNHSSPRAPPLCVIVRRRLRRTVHPQLQRMAKDGRGNGGRQLTEDTVLCHRRMLRGDVYVPLRNHWHSALHRDPRTIDLYGNEDGVRR